MQAKLKKIGNVILACIVTGLLTACSGGGGGGGGGNNPLPLWQQINESGFGDVANNRYGGVATIHNNKLYLFVCNTTTGFQLWVYDGSNWEKNGEDGFGDPDNWSVRDVIDYNGRLAIELLSNVVYGIRRRSDFLLFH